MVKQWTPLAWRVCLDVAKAGRGRNGFNVEADDLFAYAYDRLYVCARLFDPARGYSFSTYAVPSLRRAVWRKAQSQYLRARISRGHAEEGAGKLGGRRVIGELAEYSGKTIARDARRPWIGEAERKEDGPLQEWTPELGRVWRELLSETERMVVLARVEGGQWKHISERVGGAGKHRAWAPNVYAEAMRKLRVVATGKATVEELAQSIALEPAAKVPMAEEHIHERIARTIGVAPFRAWCPLLERVWTTRLKPGQRKLIARKCERPEPTFAEMATDMHGNKDAWRSVRKRHVRAVEAARKAVRDEIERARKSA